MHEFGACSWPQFDGMDAWVGLLPIGAIEAHGPHLPLATDGWIAQAMAQSGAQVLDAAGVRALVLPVHNYTAAGFAAGFSGTVDTDPTVTEGVVRAAAAAAENAGASLLAVVNAHFDPANTAAIREATGRWNQGGDQMPVLFFDLTRRKHAEAVGGEFATGACHAGRYEGSLMLAIRPDLVDEKAAAGLPPYPQSLADAIRDGAESFEELGGDRAYFGWPADATAAEGEVTLGVIGKLLAAEVLRALGDHDGVES